MRKDKPPVNYWEGVVSRDVAMERSRQSEEDQRKLAANSRENSEVDEEARRMESRSMREAGPSIMDKMKAPKKPLTAKQVATAPMFEKKK